MPSSSCCQPDYRFLVCGRNTRTSHFIFMRDISVLMCRDEELRACCALRGAESVRPRQICRSDRRWLTNRNVIIILFLLSINLQHTRIHLPPLCSFELDLNYYVLLIRNNKCAFLVLKKRNPQIRSTQPEATGFFFFFLLRKDYIKKANKLTRSPAQ